jgi:hypothetical protein
VAESLTILVVTRGDDLQPHLPGGLRYVDQMFAEAGMRDSLDEEEASKFWRQLRILRRALYREFGNRVRMQAVNPWTPRGLWCVARYRLRAFPCLLIGGVPHPVDAPVNEIIESVRQVLE